MSTQYNWFFSVYVQRVCRLLDVRLPGPVDKVPAVGGSHIRSKCGRCIFFFGHNDSDTIERNSLTSGHRSERLKKELQLWIVYLNFAFFLLLVVFSQPRDQQGIIYSYSTSFGKSVKVDFGFYIFLERHLTNSALEFNIKIFCIAIMYTYLFLAHSPPPPPPKRRC